jgi:hypothetical protein
MEYITIIEAETCYKNIHPFLQSAVDHAVAKNFDLYMTYDNSCECGGGYISQNMFINAIIDLTHKQNIPDHNGYTSKNKNWREYYGDDSWKPMLNYIKNDLQKVINSVFIYYHEHHSAFPGDSSFIGALCHCAWIYLFLKKND